jgi:hypothetical protein
LHEPKQVALIAVGVSVNVGGTIIVTLSVPTHPFTSVPVTVYVVVAVGVAVGEAIVVELKLASAFQTYEKPPLAVIAVDEPKHTVSLTPASIVGFGFTVTVVVPVALHPALVPTIEYIVVTVGLAVTLAPVVELRPVAGDQT